jgi:hypothetical protein
VHARRRPIEAALQAATFALVAPRRRPPVERHPRPVGPLGDGHAVDQLHFMHMD